MSGEQGCQQARQEAVWECGMSISGTHSGGRGSSLIFTHDEVHTQAMLTHVELFFTYVEV